MANIDSKPVQDATARLMLKVWSAEIHNPSNPPEKSAVFQAADTGNEPTTSDSALSVQMVEKTKTKTKTNSNSNTTPSQGDDPLGEMLKR